MFFVDITPELRAEFGMESEEPVVDTLPGTSTSGTAGLIYIYIKHFALLVFI